MNCLSCGATTTNGLALCDLCQRYANSVFEMLPVYFRNLARWTPGRAGSREVPGSRVLWMGEVVDPDRTGDRISDALDAAFNMLTTRARELADARPYLGKLLDRLSKAHREERIDEATAVAWLCVGFEKYLTSMATLDMCGDFVRDLGDHEERLRDLTVSAAPGWYAGKCRICSTATYVVPGLTWVTCSGCGATTYARDHLTAVLDEARGWTARPKRLAEAIVALVDTEQSVMRLYERIHKWGQRGDISPAPRPVTRVHKFDVLTEQITVVEEETGHPKYRLGDVLDELARKGATRLNTTTAAKAG